MRKVKAALVFIQRPDGKILAVDRLTPPFGVAIPGGTVEPGERSVDAAFRELLEETGIDANKALWGFKFEAVETFAVDYADSGIAYQKLKESAEGMPLWVTWEDLSFGPYGDYAQLLREIVES